VNFREDLTPLAFAALIAMLSSVTSSASSQPLPSGAALIGSARQEIRTLLSPDVWPAVVNGMASELGPWYPATSTGPR
jgi:hypothetical protein